MTKNVLLGDRLIFAKTKDLLLLLVINLFLSIDFTRLGTIYGTDSTIFPYNNNIVISKYYYMTFFGYYPWLNGVYGFSLATFYEYIFVYLFSNIPYSDTFFLFFLSSIGSISIYLFIKELLSPLNNKTISIISAYIGALFYILSPSLGNDLYTDALTTIYINAFLPALIYLIRKYFTTEKLCNSLVYLLITFPVFLFLYYMVIPIFGFSFALLFGTIGIFYIIKALRKARYFRVILIILILLTFAYLKLSEIVATYNAFTSKSFLEESYEFWVSNSLDQPLYLTLLGLRYNQIINDLYIYIFSLLLFIISVMILFDKKLYKYDEILMVFSLSLIFTFLYSMPNVPFSHFWKSLFFKYPILADLRTQYVEVSPFQNLLMAYIIGFGSYALLTKTIILKRKILKALPYLFIFISLIGIATTYGAANIIHGGSYVIIQNSFLQTVNHINRLEPNSSVLVLPISPTENAESWYHGPNLFALFLRPQVILGGGYYSVSMSIREVLCNAYSDIYYGNLSNEAINYVKNVFYLFNIQYLIVEKDYNNTIYPTYPSDWTLNVMQEGLNKYENAGIIHLVFNNTNYEIYSTHINSSLAFYSYNNYSLGYILSSDNISGILHPLEIKYISPLEYIIEFNLTKLNKSIYLYLMIPYSSYLKIKGAQVLQESSFNGYTLFKIEPDNNKIIVYYDENYILNIAIILSLNILPLLIAFIMYIERDKIDSYCISVHRKYRSGDKNLKLIKDY